VTARDRTVLVAVLAVALLAGGWLVIVSPRRDQASKLAHQITAEQTQLDNARSQVAQGESARNQFASDYTQLVRLGEAVPYDDDVPSLIYQLQGAASSAGIDFRNLQVAAAGAGAPPAASGSSSSSSSSGQLPPGVANGPAGVPVEQFSFVLQGSFFHLADFFNRLQRFVVAGQNQIAISGRLLSINGISFSAAPQGFPQITANVSATAYLAQPLQLPGAGGGASSMPAGSSSTTPTGSSTTPTGSAGPSSTKPGVHPTSSTPSIPAPAAVSPVIR
jgi:outer membrane murein-binding lipoprotein Lpp